jgi:hypothetical protein
VKSTASVVGTGGESDGGGTVIRGRQSSLSYRYRERFMYNGVVKEEEGRLALLKPFLQFVI